MELIQGSDCIRSVARMLLLNVILWKVEQRFNNLEERLKNPCESMFSWFGQINKPNTTKATAEGFHSRWNPKRTYPRGQKKMYNSNVFEKRISIVDFCIEKKNTFFKIINERKMIFLRTENFAPQLHWINRSNRRTNAVNVLPDNRISQREQPI